MMPRRRNFAAFAFLSCCLTLLIPRGALPSADGVWTQFAPPGGLGLPSLTYDPIRDRFLLFGGSDSKSHNEVWELPLATREWRQILPMGSPPAPRLGHAAIYDPLRDRLLIVAGADGGQILGDAWGLSLSGTPSWDPLPATGLPARYRHSMVYDPAQDRILVVGGTNSVFAHLLDVWSLPLGGAANWSRVVASGTPPPRQELPAAIVDPARHQLLVFGGMDSAGVLHQDVWSLALDGTPAWTTLAPSGTPPSPRQMASALYDPDADRLIVYGGVDSTGPRNDAWALALSGTPSWAPLGATSPPAPRQLLATTRDATRNRLVLYGGYSQEARYLSDLWVLPLTPSSAWEQVPTTPGSFPFARYGAMAAYDPVRDRIVVYGGYDGNRSLPGLWSFPLSGNAGWNLLEAAEGGPGPRSAGTMIYDPVGDRMILFGGADDQYVKYNDVWSLSLTGTPTWAALAPAGAPPGARWDHAAVYDPVGRRMVMFGGEQNYAPPEPTYPNDTWELSLAGPLAWTKLTVSGPLPLGRMLPTFVFDPGSYRIVMFGGHGGYGVGMLGDLWTLSLGPSPAWSAPAAGAGPGLGYGAPGIYDSVRARMVMFGIFPSVPESWALSLVGGLAWTRLSSAGDLPGPRRDHMAIYDPVRDRMIVSGGVGANDTWALTFAESPTPVLVSLVRVDARPGAVRLQWRVEQDSQSHVRLQRRTESSAWETIASLTVDPAGMIAYEDAGVVPGTSYGYRLTLEAAGEEVHAEEVWAEVPLVPRFALAGARPNPTSAAISVQFTLTDGSPARLELLDLGGRRILTRDVAGLGPGTHLLPLERTGILPAGVYLLRLTQGGRSATARAAVLR